MRVLASDRTLPAQTLAVKEPAVFVLAAVLLLHVAPQGRDTVRSRADSLAADSVRARHAQQLEGVQVNAIRTGSAPISEKTLGRADIQRTYVGQETPILLQATPGVTAYSESGSASNYSYIRLRGIDQTRLNLTLDGVPLNEPEDQSLYFSNFPDFANSIASVQVQRGVGTSTYGVASYAGSVNFESIPIAGVQHGGEGQLTIGSYNTTRGSLVYQTGLTPSGFAGYLRGSAQQTDGYRFNSGNRSRSMFASGGWFGERDVLKVTLLAGLSSNDQAYYASPLSVLAVTPRDNPFGNARSQEVTDRFHQDLLSAQWTHALSEAASFGTTVYGFDAGGWYDFPGDAGLSDAYHYYLHSRWGGMISAFTWRDESSTFSTGLNVSRYSREHWLTQRPDLVTRAYDNTGHKGEQSAFAKGSHTTGRTTLSADLQLRSVQFRYEPTVNSGVQSASVRWSFINPKVGATVALSPQLSVYASAGMNGREPTRSDLFAGADDVDSSTARSVFPLTRVHPETAYDLETGLTWNTTALHLQGNVFYMQFHNEIAAIGGVSALGYDLRKNVDRSRRLGVEGDATWTISPSLTALATIAVTDAKISDYRDDAAGLSYHDVTPVMTPTLVSNHGLRGTLAPWLSFDVNGRYVSRMMLTNTGDARFAVPDAWYADAGATARVNGESVLFLLRNVFDRRVYTGGYPSGSESAYYVLAPRNVSVNLRITF